MINIIVTLVIVTLFILAFGYIIRAKKKGQVCIGCSNASECGKKCSCSHLR